MFPLDALEALAQELEFSDSPPTTLVVIGGAALSLTGLVERVTKDVDVLAEMIGSTLVAVTELPAHIAHAAQNVASILGLSDKWINVGPAALTTWGLPTGFIERCSSRSFGPRLTLKLASRFDQIHFKTYAGADMGPGRHIDDLRALAPTQDEMISSAAWARSQDPSEGFRQMLGALFTHLGFDPKDVPDAHDE